MMSVVQCVLHLMTTIRNACCLPFHDSLPLLPPPLPPLPPSQPILSGLDNGTDRFLHFGLSSEFWKKTMFKCNLHVAKDIEWLWRCTDVVAILNRLEVKLYIWNCDFRSCITLTCCSFYLVCQYWTEGNMIITLHKGA